MRHRLAILAAAASTAALLAGAPTTASATVCNPIEYCASIFGSHDPTGYYCRIGMYDLTTRYGVPCEVRHLLGLPPEQA